MKKKLSSMLLLAGALLTIVPAHPAASCHIIEAKAVGQDDGTGRTMGKVIGGGLLQGTVEGAVTPTSPPVNGIVTFTEIVKFTNGRGTLTVEVAGGINIVTGQFNASGSVKDATGKLAGATGNITFSGVADFTTGLFTENITGLICVDLAP